MSRILPVPSVAVLFGAMWIVSTGVVAADPYKDCLEGEGQVRIDGCASILESGQLNGKQLNDPTRANMLFNKAIGFTEIGDDAGVVESLDQAISLNDTDADFFIDAAGPMHV